MANFTLCDRKLVILGTLAASGAACAFVWFRRYLRNRPPKEWVKVGEVSDLYVYPVKSCKGMKSEEVQCTLFGGKIGELRDRMFVVVNLDGVCVTGREHPKLTQLKATSHEGKLRLNSVDSADSIDLDFLRLHGPTREIRIWNAKARGVDCGDEIAGWLSRYLINEDRGFRLLYCGCGLIAKEISPNMSKIMKVLDKDYKPKDSALFSDSMSYHLISEASVNELNGRLGVEQVTPLCFRPNIVVKGEMLIPFEEDDWDWVKIGDVVFRMLSPCTRCLFTTVDPDTGKKSENAEPLKTLRKYRMARDSRQRNVFSSPKMGVYMGVRSVGSIRVGDDVMIAQANGALATLPGFASVFRWVAAI